MKKYFKLFSAFIFIILTISNTVFAAPPPTQQTVEYEEQKQENDNTVLFLIAGGLGGVICFCGISMVVVKKKYKNKQKVGFNKNTSLKYYLKKSKEEKINNKNQY
ncbi:MAG: hypothetical protein RR640_01310 [Oscillospiraceae bacterium]